MATDKKQLIQRFLRTLGHDIKHYQALLPLLKTQRDLYLTFDADLLQANASQQMPLLAALKRSSGERSQCLEQLGLSADETGVSRMLAVLPHAMEKQARSQWSTLKNLVMQCQQYNTENGQVSANFQEMLSQVTATSPYTYPESTP